MIGLPAKGRQETDYGQINKTLCLYISSAAESEMLLSKETIGTACSQESFERQKSLHSDLAAARWRWRGRVLCILAAASPQLCVNLFSQTLDTISFLFACEKKQQMNV